MALGSGENGLTRKVIDVIYLFILFLKYPHFIPAGPIYFSESQLEFWGPHFEFLQIS